MENPTGEDWGAIQAAVDDDCPMSIVGQLMRGVCTPTQALDRIEAYAVAAFNRGRTHGQSSPPK